MLKKVDECNAAQVSEAEFPCFAPRRGRHNDDAIKYKCRLPKNKRTHFNRCHYE